MSTSRHLCPSRLPSVLALAFLASLGLAQRPLPPGNDRDVTLRGRIVADDVGALPVIRARVSAQALGQRTVEALTDRDGVFALTVPRADRYQLTVTKGGFAPHEVASRESADPLLIRLPRGAVVTGRVFDAFGPAIAPLVLRGMTAAGGPLETLQFSDDEGAFRFGSLPAGRYELFLHHSPTALIARMSSPGRPPTSAGSILAPHASPAAGVSVAAGETADVSLTYAPDAGDLAVTVRVAGGIATIVGSAGNVRWSVGSRDGATIIGRLHDTNGQPVGGASVVLEPVTAGAAMTAVSAADGRYGFRGVPAGTFRLVAARNGFMASAYGWTAVPHQGRSVAVAGRTPLEGMDIVMPRAAAITGRIVDDYGEPLEGIAVQPWALAFDEAGAILTAVDASSMAASVGAELTRSDDRGYYRIHGLPPGTYYVSALHAPTPSPDARSAAAAASLRWIYAPGRLSPVDAAPVRVDAGIDAAGIDLVFDRTLLGLGGRVTGRVTDASGAPVEGTAVLTTQRRPGSVAAPAMRRTVGADGLFDFSSVPPGDYVVHVVQRGLPAFPRASARQFVTVTPDGPSPLDITMSAGATITGRILLESTGTRARPSEFKLAGVSADAHGIPSQLNLRPWALITPDDVNFEIGGLAGAMRFVAERVPEGWWLRALTIDGVDAAVEPVVFDPRDEPRRGLRAVFADSAAEIAGHVLDERQAPPSSYAVLVFATDRRRWFRQSPFVRLAAPAERGRFRVTSLPPGEYWIVAVDAVEGDAGGSAWQQPGELDRLIPWARRLALSERQREDVELRLVRLPR